MTHSDPLAAIVAILLSALLAAGCSPASQGEKMQQSYSRTRDTLADAQKQVDATLFALEALRRTPGAPLKDAFARFKEEVAKLESEAASAKAGAAAMKAEQEAHIRAWQEEMKNLQDPAMKSTLESRQQAVRSNFKLVQMYADDVRKKYEPFLNGNKQLVQALSIDLSAAAVASLSGSIDRIVADGGALKERMAAMQNALANITNGVSPLGQ